MINGLNIYYTTKKIGQGLEPVSTKGKGLEPVTTKGKGLEPVSTKGKGKKNRERIKNITLI